MLEAWSDGKTSKSAIFTCFGLDITNIARPIRKQLMQIAFLHFENIKARGEYGASIAKNYRNWLEEVNKEG